MIDTDKYEPTQIETLLHNTRAHSPDGWRKLSKSLFELSDDDRLLIEYAPTLRAEVKRLREQVRLAKEWIAKQYPCCLNTMDIFTEYIGDEEE
jgi:hypothetical protein